MIGLDRFHADLRAVMVKEPFFKSFEIRVEGGELSFDVRSNATVVCDGNGGNYKFFVDIHAAADKVLNRQHR